MQGIASPMWIPQGDNEGKGAGKHKWASQVLAQSCQSEGSGLSYLRIAYFVLEEWIVIYILRNGRKSESKRGL